LDREVLLQFEGKKIRLERRSTDVNSPWATFKLTGVIKQVNKDSIVFFTDHIGIINISEIVAIEELRGE
jgi:hypothetical protein